MQKHWEKGKPLTFSFPRPWKSFSPCSASVNLVRVTWPWCAWATHNKGPNAVHKYQHLREMCCQPSDSFPVKVGVHQGSAWTLMVFIKVQHYHICCSFFSWILLWKNCNMTFLDLALYQWCHAHSYHQRRTASVCADMEQLPLPTWLEPQYQKDWIYRDQPEHCHHTSQWRSSED